MKNRIGFIAIGQAGGNIGSRLELRGYPVLYINTSQEDLDTLGNAKYKHHIKNGEGCNKDRLKAKQALIDDYDAISRKIVETLNTEFIYVIFSAGGGTGSGAGPMQADLLLEDISDGLLKTKNVGIITILPGLRELVKTNINAYECFSELSKIDGLSSIFVLDNNLNEKMVINNQFVNTLTSFLDIPAKHKSERGNIDKAEIMETIKAPGMIKICQMPAKESKTENIIKNFDSKMFAESEHDGIVKYITVSQAGAFDEEILEKETGMPVDVFTTYNEHSTICCLSGLTYPATRLDKTYEYINDNKEKLQRAVNANTSIELKECIDILQNSARNKPVRETRREYKDNSANTRSSRRDLLKKYIK